MRGRGAVLAGALVAAIAVPASASAATKTVQAGPFGGAQAQFQQSFGDANEFFRRTVTIHRGDRVRWNIFGFHTVTFVPRGDAPPGLIVPDPATPVADVRDAAGQLFWFNGQPSLRPNPLVALPQGSRTHDPGELANSGLPLGAGAPPPYTLKFPRTGSFRYLCIVHPGMEGTVKVVKPNRAIPSARKDRRVANRQLGRTLRAVKRLTTGAGLTLDKTMQAGNDRRSGATIFRYFPAQPAYKVGDTVTLQMPPRTTEVHTFTFGPSNGQDAYNDQLAAGLLGEVFDPRGAYPSEPPPAVSSYTGTNHGNGFWNSGILDGDAATPLPASTQVTFTAPGSFALICLIHPFMTSTVTVTP